MNAATLPPPPPAAVAPATVTTDPTFPRVHKWHYVPQEWQRFCEGSGRDSCRGAYCG